MRFFFSTEVLLAVSALFLIDGLLRRNHYLPFLHMFTYDTVLTESHSIPTSSPLTSFNIQFSARLEGLWLSTKVELSGSGLFTNLTEIELRAEGTPNRIEDRENSEHLYLP
jgi:hypothetical protein